MRLSSLWTNVGAGLGLACTAFLGGCATLQPPDVPFGSKCRALFAEVDAKVDAAGVRDGSYFPIDGFPYLRSDRFSASFRDELDDPEAFRAWTENLRQNDVVAREAELTNLGMSRQQRTETMINLRSCSAWLINDELQDAAWRQHLMESVAPPDEYSSIARVAGLYPLTAPLLRLGIQADQEQVRRDYRRPLQSLDAPGELLLWRARRSADPTAVPADLAKVERDELGRAGLFISAWQALAETYAPNLWIETAAAYDRPGVPVLDARPGVDPAQPTVYYLETFTRMHGQMLVQLVYVIWFSERPPAGALDSHAGALDGLVWRVTLDRHGKPLMYDSVHAGGDHHYFFPVQELPRLERGGLWQEPALFPQAQVPDGAVSVRVQSKTHDVRRVVPLEAAAPAQAQTYELRPYEDLLTLPAPGGGTRSLFDRDGIVAGTERSARWWLWPSGVHDAGAMRQWGRLPTALVGRSEFDDPRFMESLFADLPADQRAPSSMSAEAAPAGAVGASGTR